MKRQEIEVTLSQLTDLKMNLIKKQQYLNKELDLENQLYVDYNQKFKVGIINKTPECLDTWELE